MLRDQTGCPCGCGRFVGQRSSGPATQYPELRALLEASTPALNWISVARIDDDSWQGTQDAAERFRANCERVLAYQLEHLHGTAEPRRTPDIVALSRLTQMAKDGLLESVAVSESLGGPGLDTVL